MYKLTKLPADIPVKRVETCKHCGGESLVVWDQGCDYNPKTRAWGSTFEMADCRNPDCPTLYRVSIDYRKY